uniref:Uncharacterized protein n=1 Tax=Nelumbo nucifera TaxID=4432 RepID=A0A822XSB0_NELNU|nr:TPA_asm: hypothetical protein HUJ06_023504 [Nelumbo nucifera]
MGEGESREREREHLILIHDFLSLLLSLKAGNVGISVWLNNASLSFLYHLAASSRMPCEGAYANSCS